MIKDYSATLVVPTQDRPKQLGAMLRYIAIAFDMEVIVIDGSEISQEDSFQGEGRVRYFHRPNQGSMARFCEGIELCETEYCLPCPDDDFPIAHGIEKSIRILNRDASISSAFGSFYDFQFHSKQHVNITLKYLSPYLRNLYPRCLSTGPVARLEHLSQNFVHLVWGVHRTNSAQKVVSAIRAAGAYERALGETFFTFAMALTGRYIIHPSAMFLRDSTPRSPDQLTKARTYVFSDIPELNQSYCAALNALCALAPDSIDTINRESRYDFSFHSVEEWLDAVYKDFILPSHITPAPLPKVLSRVFELDDLKLVGEIDSGAVIGDVDTDISSFRLALQFIQEEGNEADTHAIRFGKKPPKAMTYPLSDPPPHKTSGNALGVASMPEHFSEASANPKKTALASRLARRAASAASTLLGGHKH